MFANHGVSGAAWVKVRTSFRQAEGLVLDGDALQTEYGARGKRSLRCGRGQQHERLVGRIRFREIRGFGLCTDSCH